MNKDSQNVIDLKACSSVKEMVLNAQETIVKLESALYEILEARTLNETKIIASDVLEEDLETYLEKEDVSELDFEKEDYFVEDSMSRNFESGD